MSRYDFQNAAVIDACEFFATASPGERRLYAAPTGTGKSYIQRRVQEAVADSWIVTPRVEIGLDMLRKRGVTDPSVAVMHEHHVCTPIVLRNRMLSGDWPAPKALIIDEAHHHTSETYQLIDLLTGLCPAVGYTATPYRGTPRQTAEFRRQWGDPLWVLSYPAAVASSVLSMPTCEIVPLVDDDVVTVTNGQFEVESINDATMSRLDDAVRLLAPFFSGYTWDRATMISVPSRQLAREFWAAAQRYDTLPMSIIDGDTPSAERQRIFAATVARQVALIQIQVVSEGVDLPIRRLLDLHPMLSPVEWLQSFGRITRPVSAGENPPQYICTNRNLMRHAYLLDGCLPPETVAACEKAFGGPSTRLGSRGLGLESLGRFAGAEIPFADGTTGICYSVSCCEGLTTRQYACIVHPMRAEPLWAVRENQRTDDPMKPHYGRWKRCDPPTDVSGFASIPPSAITDKQKWRWQTSAKRHGLNPDAKVTRKNITALFVLRDLRERI